MSNLLTWDQSIKVGDYVTSSYHDKDLIFIVKDIKKRFITKHDIRYREYFNNLGEEYNPLVELEPLLYLANYDSKKKPRTKTRQVDGAYLSKVTTQFLEEYIKSMESHIDNIKRFITDKLI